MAALLAAQLGQLRPRVHGVPLVSSAVVTAGFTWLLSSGGWMFYTKGGVRVDPGYYAKRAA